MLKRAYDACVIAASAGGVSAIIELLSGLKPGFPLAVIVVLHSASQEDRLAGVLGSRCAIPAQVADAAQSATPGHIWIAPAAYHLLVEKNRRFSLSLDDKVCFVRPSANVLFESAADAWRERLIGIVLTGGNEDGAEGLRMIRSRGGLAIVQDPADAEAPEMPAAALNISGADHILPLNKIAALLNQLAYA